MNCHALYMMAGIDTGSAYIYLNLHAAIAAKNSGTRPKHADQKKTHAPSVLAHTTSKHAPSKTSHLNRGIIFGVPKDITNDEMSTSIGRKAERILKKRGPNQIITEQVIIYCEYELPRFVYDGWNRYITGSAYIYLNLHAAIAANSSGTRPKHANQKRHMLSGTHDPKACPIKDTHLETKTPTCPNCGGSHTAAYRGCPRFR